MHRKRLALIIAGTVLLIIGAAAGVLIYKKYQKPPVIPKSLTSSLSFPAYYPEQGNTTWQTQEDKTSYDKETGVLTVIVKGSLAEITLTQQSTPDAFSDIPQQYSRLLNSLNQYGEQQTAFGTVALTRPKELNGGQTAVINKSGTLLFAKPSADLTDDEWKVFFETLRLAR